MSSKRQPKQHEVCMYLGNGEIACEVVYPTTRRGVGIRLQPIEPMPIGSDAAKSRPKKNQPKVLIQIGKVESAVVLLECVTKVLRYLCNPKERERMDAVLAAQQAEAQKALPSPKQRK